MGRPVFPDKVSTAESGQVRRHGRGEERRCCPEAAAPARRLQPLPGRGLGARSSLISGSVNQALKGPPASDTRPCSPGHRAGFQEFLPPTTPSRVWSPTQGHPHPCQHLPAGVHLPAGAGPSGRSGAGRPRPARSHSESSPRGSEAGPGTAISAPLQRGQRVSAGLSSPGTSSGLSATWLQTGHPGPALGHSRCRAAPHRTPAWGQESLSWGLEGQLQQRL